nr:uncharacterized protein moto [Solea senegalensis]XP_043905980.1 uncharacterized protein moto [Solea senegalensis]
MMAFDGLQTRTFANSLIPSYQHQAGADVGGENNGNKTWSFLSIPGVSLQNQETASYVPWSHAHEDPYDLINCLQNSSMNRKPTDNSDCDGENEGLMSNILNGAHSQDNNTERSHPTFNPFWSPKKSSEELMQYSQSEAKMQHNPNLSSNYVSREAFSKAHGQSMDKDVGEFCPQSNGLAINHQLLFNWANVDRDNHVQRVQKVPPGLPAPKVGNNYMSLIQQSKCDISPADRERRKSHPVNNFSDVSDVLRYQSPCFDPYYEDSYIQSSTKSSSNDQYVPQVSSFESFTAGKHGSFPNIHKQMFGMSHDDGLVEQCKFNGPSVSTKSSPTMQSQKLLMADVGVMQRERNGVRKQILKREAFQDHLLEDRQQPQPFSPSVNLPNQYQSKMSIPRESITLNINQDIRHHILQGQIQNKVKPQMKKENAMVHMPAFLGENLLTRSLNNSHMKGGAKKQVFNRSPPYDLQGGSQSLTFNGENGVVSTGSTQQCVPPIYPGRSSIPHNFSSRSTLLYGDLHDRSTMNESALFNSCVREMVTNRVENTNHGRASVVMNKGGPVVHLYFRVDECFEQWRCLERERKRAEVVLVRTFDGKRIAAVTNTSLLKSPPNPTRVDHLLVKQIREQSKVASLMNWMECLHNSPLPNVGTVLNQHHMVICFTQARREEELSSMSRHQQQQRAYITESRENLMIIALKELAATTRMLRKALWCALQVTLPKSDKRQENHGNKEATCREGLTSPFTQYSFK